jgi:uncharacterized membrane protein (DUF373 family)
MAMPLLEEIYELLAMWKRNRAISITALIVVGCLFVAGVVCLYGTHAVLTAAFAVVDLAAFGGLLWTRFYSKSARENRRLFEHYQCLERAERAYLE